MGSDLGAAKLNVVVCFADVGSIWQRELQVSAGTTLGQAIEASGFKAAYPHLQDMGTGVFGKAMPLDHVLQDLDRVEIYRPLSFDPMVSRRRRAEHRAKAAIRALNKANAEANLAAKKKG
jgi:putative ubiquitin-RnfH superfamily antitoxin RatB of RatAB toxin-antitoxin module